jgi:hypothetical protein
VRVMRIPPVEGAGFEALDLTGCIVANNPPAAKAGARIMEFTPGQPPRRGSGGCRRKRSPAGQKIPAPRKKYKPSFPSHHF